MDTLRTRANSAVLCVTTISPGDSLRCALNIIGTDRCPYAGEVCAQLPDHNCVITVEGEKREGRKKMVDDVSGMFSPFTLCTSVLEFADCDGRYKEFGGRDGEQFFMKEG